MRLQIIFAIVCLAVCLGASAPQAGKSDQDAIQGVSQLVEGKDKNKVLTKDEVKRLDAHLTFKGNTMHYKGNALDGGYVFETSAAFRLDPTKSPKHIDLTDNKDGRMHRGIYELNGDDLKLSIKPPTVDRPVDFNSSDFMIYRRVKKLAGWCGVVLARELKNA